MPSAEWGKAQGRLNGGSGGCGDCGVDATVAAFGMALSGAGAVTSEAPGVPTAVLVRIAGEATWRKVSAECSTAKLPANCAEATATRCDCGGAGVTAGDGATTGTEDTGIVTGGGTTICTRTGDLPWTCWQE